MEYRIETTGDATVVHLKGAFDRSARRKIEMELLALVTNEGKLLIDLSEVDFISSAGLHLLLELYRRCARQNARLALTGLSDPVLEILSIAGLTSSGLPIYESLEDGLDALRKTTHK